MSRLCPNLSCSFPKMLWLIRVQSHYRHFIIWARFQISALIASLKLFCIKKCHYKLRVTNCFSNRGKQYDIIWVQCFYKDAISEIHPQPRFHIFGKLSAHVCSVAWHTSDLLFYCCFLIHFDVFLYFYLFTYYFADQNIWCEYLTFSSFCYRKLISKEFFDNLRQSTFYAIVVYILQSEIRYNTPFSVSLFRSPPSPLSLYIYFLNACPSVT